MSRFRGFGDVFMQLAEERPVAYYPKLVKVAGSVNAAIFLSQLGYWTPKAADPDGWVYKTQIEWEAETGLSRWEQETARRLLKERQILTETKRGMPARLFFKIDVEALTATWEAVFSTLDEDIPQPRMRDPHKQGPTRENAPSSRMPGPHNQRRGEGASKDVAAPQSNKETGTTTGTTSTTTGGGGKEINEDQLRSVLPELLVTEGIESDLIATAIDEALAALRVTVADRRLTTGPVAYCLGVAKRLQRERTSAAVREEAGAVVEQRRLELETTCPHGAEWATCERCLDDIEKGRRIRSGLKSNGRGEAVA